MATMAANALPNAVFPKSHVGFDSITQQIEKKLLKRGFQFNVICVGTQEALQKLARLEYTDLKHRPDRARQIHAHQHHLRVPPYRQQRPHAAR